MQNHLRRGFAFECQRCGCHFHVNHFAAQPDNFVLNDMQRLVVLHHFPHTMQNFFPIIRMNEPGRRPANDLSRALRPQQLHARGVDEYNFIVDLDEQRIRQLVPMGEPLSIELMDVNRVVLRIHWLRWQNDAFLLTTLGVAPDAADVRDAHAQAIMSELVGS